MSSEAGGSLSPLKRAYLAIEDLETRLEQAERRAHEAIAVVGIGLRFPAGVTSPDEYWKLLLDGIDAVTPVPADRWDIDAYFDLDPDSPGKIASRFGAFISDVDQFDPLFFGISPREAERMDPQQRLLLETAWEAIERAGISAERLEGSRTGVFVGIATDDYAVIEREAFGVEGFDQYYASGFAHSIATGRLSYALGLHGPSIAVDTACSSSLVATHLAVQSLRNRESDLALAGGVNLMLTPETSIALSRLRMLAPDGHCKAFDASADGFVRSEGCGVVVLKRLTDAVADHDPILAVILGSAVNQDGRSNGLTAPNGPAQEAVLRAALADAGLPPSAVTYVEAHGTGTSLGDPIEARALGAVLGERGDAGPLLVGSVKTNLGHLEAAAGMAGLIKVVLMLNQGQVPPSLHFQTPSPHIPWETLPLRIPTAVEAWPAGAARVAGVSSFGFSGTNAHLILEAPPDVDVPEPTVERDLHLLPLSGHTPAALKVLAGRYAQHLTAHPEKFLADMAATAGAGRAHHAERLAVLARDQTEAIARLEAVARGESGPGILRGRAASEPPAVAFLFTGQGSQYPGMGRQLYGTSPVFRDALDQCAELLVPHLDQPLLELLFAEPDSPEATMLDQTQYTQPALFALEYALAQLWRSWGIQPAAVAGHSLGEYVAACVAGVLSLEDGLRLVAARGRLMGSLPAGGAMAAVFASEAHVRAALNAHGDRVAIAAVNGPEHIVVSGDAEAVRAVTRALAAEGLRVQNLNVSHAFHSALMEPILGELGQQINTINLQAPSVRVFTNLDGTGATDALASAEYWLRQTREPVRFADAIASMHGRGYGLFLEIGPHPVLAGMGRNCTGGDQSTWLPSLRRGRQEWETILNSLGSLYTAGVDIDWPRVTAGYASQRADLPTYPFQHQRYWVPIPQRSRRDASRKNGEIHPLLGSRLRSALRETQFEAEIAPEDLSYLNDHRIFGRPILPAAAFVEMGITAGAKSGNHNLDDLVIQSPMAFDDATSRVLQTIVSPDDGGDRLQIFSRALESDEWVLHAEGRLSLRDDSEPSEPVDLDTIRTRCPKTLDVDEHYTALADRGIELGQSLRAVRHISRGEHEALAEIVLGTEEDEAGEYVVHPALLDGAFQTLAAAVSGNNDAYLPIAVERVRVVGEPGVTAYCHARMRTAVTSNGHGPRETLTADLTLFDGEGRPVLDVQGLSLRRASESVSEPLDRLFYEIVWQPDSRTPSQPAAERLIACAQKVLEDEPERRGDLDRYVRVNSELDALSRDYVLRAFEHLGWRPATGDRVTGTTLAAQLGVMERNNRLLERLLEILTEDGLLQVDGSAYVVTGPWTPPALTDIEARQAGILSGDSDFDAELTLLERCGPHLAAILSGVTDPLHLLFPDGDASAAERLYTESPVARTFNSMVRAAVAEIVDARPAQPLRVLEVGGGTGGTTTHVLPVLPAERTEYTFTDISPAFTSRAAEKFRAYPFVSYQALNIEEDPVGQSLTGGQYDIVLAVNVVHAVRDVRESLEHIRGLLNPGGVLLLVEVTGRQRWVDLTFGLTDGWWRFTDHDLRTDYPLLDDGRWLDVLGDLGFDAAALSGSATSDAAQALIVARSPSGDLVKLAGDWMILADDTGTGDDLARLIAGRGGRPIVVHHGNAFAHDDDDFRVDPFERGDFTRLMDEAVTDVTSLKGVVHLWGLDSNPINTGRHEGKDSTALAGALHMVQSAASIGASPRVWLVTRGAQPAGSETVSCPDHASLWGFGKALALEHPELHPTRVDLAEDLDHPAQALLDELLSAGDEREVALRTDGRHVPRLCRMEGFAAQSSSTEASADVELAIEEPGSFEGLKLRPMTRRRPGPGEVEIRVQATGLNFKDVMNVLAMYPGDPGPLGGECAGTVVAVGPVVSHLRPGDEVVALAGGSFRSYVTTSTGFVTLRPSNLTPEVAATTSIPYVTASFALDHLGNVGSGERVLIHAATGGVGMAAVNIARAAGAEVFATAGSPEKRDYLRELGVEHVYDSRSLAFADEILSDTNGEGVDLVLNSLSGEFIPRSLQLLRNGGRFLELGKRDHVSAEGIAELGRDITYHVIDWSETAGDDPELIASIFHDVLARVADEWLPTLPVRTFAMDEAVDAFRYMARAQHIGKVAVTQPALSSGRLVDPDGWYLITGGLRGLGLEVGCRLVALGARHLLLMGRSEPGPETRAAFEVLESDGVEVLVHSGDVSERADVEAVFATIDRTGRRLDGVFHCAGVLADAAVTQQTWERFRHVLAPKADGAWLLHLLTQGRDISHFVLFSSVAAVLGAPGQSNHSAANAYLDTLAWYRRGLGLPALSINWGAWGQVGAAARDGVAGRAHEHGLEPMSPEAGLDALELLLGQGTAQAVVASIRWPAMLGRYPEPPPFLREFAPAVQKQAAQATNGSRSDTGVLDLLATASPGRRFDIVLDFVQSQAGHVLGISADQLGPTTPLNEYGLDSLMAVELRNRLGQGLSLAQPLPATLVFDYPTAESMTQFLMSAILGFDDDSTNGEATFSELPPVANGDLVSAMLDGLDSLSDDEIDALLADRTSQRG